MTNKLTSLDLFAGAGGLSWGFRQAGIATVEAVEIDDWAATTFEKNLPDSKVYRADILKLTDDFFKGFIGVDAVIGGPPCQGFSISASNRRIGNDPRNFLYREFLRAISTIHPKVILIENVKEFGRMRNDHGERILEEIVRFLNNIGYSISSGTLNAKYFGVPQDRVRFFLLASKYKKPELPFGTHGNADSLFAESGLLTLWDAISDLPVVEPRVHKENAILDYAIEPHNSYQVQMREGSNRIHNHIPMRHTNRIIERFSKIQIGTNGSNLPESLKPYLKEDRGRVSDRVYSQNHRRLDPHKPCSTITASFYSSFIHPYQDRNLTVREAARVQSFPDSFTFYGKKTRLSHKLLMRKGIFEEVHLDQFNQVGNAVPPLLAKALAESLLRTMR